MANTVQNNTQSKSTGELCKYCKMTDCPMDHSAQIAAEAAGAVYQPPSKGVLCKYCQMIDCPMHPVDGQVALKGTLDEPVIMKHPGIPPQMAFGGMILIIIMSHLLLAYRRRKPASDISWQFNLFNISCIKKLIRNKRFPLIAQTISILLFVLIVVAGLWGSQRTNIAPVLTWNLWWAMLIFMIVAFGSMFCMICPWEGITSIITSLSFTSRKKKIGFERKWPKMFKNIYLALLMFILLTWLELGLDITRSPSMTAVMALGYLALAVLVAIVFEKRSFCRYLCLVGRIQGIYSLFSPVELKRTEWEICRKCESKACVKGSDEAVGCPTMLFPGAMQDNSQCTLCTECIRACPHDNLQINICKPASDLEKKTKFYWDEAIMAVVLLALTSFHGLTMTPPWQVIVNFLRVKGNMSEKLVFTILMGLMISFTVGLFWTTATTARKLSLDSRVSTAQIFKAFAYAIIPIALFYHLAHNGMHFFMEVQHLIPLLSDPFGFGWDLFGTANKTYMPLMTLNAIWWLQIVLIIIGHLYSVIVSDRIAHRLFKNKIDARLSLIPLVVTMILYSGFSVWLIAMPMEMRSGM